MPPTDRSIPTSGRRVVPGRRVGLRYDLRADPDDGSQTEPAAAYRTLLRHAEAAERAGIDVLWVAERPFAPGAKLPAAFPLLAAIAARTRRARLATGVLPLPLHHPLRVAEDAASLDLISGGRLELGVGLGDHAEGFDGFGVALGERTTRLEEAIALLRQAWGDGPVTFDGEHHRIEDVGVHPKPDQRPHPPLWIAATARGAVERAARLETGLLTDSLEAARHFVETRPSGAEPARITWFHGAGQVAEPEALLDAYAGAAGELPGAALDLLLPAEPEDLLRDPELAGLTAFLERFRSAFA